MKAFVNKPVTLILILAAIGSLAGLSIAQVFVLREAMDANQLLFEQKIGLVSQNISQAFRQHNQLASTLEYALHNNDLAKSRMEAFDPAFRKFIDSVFQSCGLSLDYQYGIFAHAGDDNAFTAKWTTIDDPNFNFNACENFAQANLTCGNGYHSGYHMAMVFPAEQLYLFRESGRSIFISIVFIIIISISFVYAIATIRRQKKLSDLKNDFINNLTHEFKTPVFSMGVALKTIKKTSEFQQSGKIQKYVEVIENQNERLKNQVDKILQLALVQSGNFMLDKKIVDLHEALKRVINNFRLTIEERNAKITVELRATAALIRADETHLTNAVYNLIDNALKFTERIPDIRLSTFDHEYGIAIVVSDNGVGIPKTVEKLVFEKFYQYPAGDHSNGFGLGLYYVKSVVEAHLGRISVKSVPGEGSEFLIYLPLHA